MTTPHKPSAGGSGSTSTFFQKERDRLIKEIADGIGQVLGDANTLNRKLEESIAVGQEFEPISSLWGRFVEMMSTSGITTQAAAADVNNTNPQAQADGEGRGNEVVAGNPLASSTASDEVEDTLPLGVAPGGGTVYGRD